jgi:hypothetical protein
MPSLPHGYHWRILGPEELAQHCIDAEASVQADRFAQKLQCLGVFDRKNQLAGISWLGTGHHNEGELAIRFIPPTGAAWDTGLWIPDDKRMGRAFTAAWGAIGSWLASQDLDWSVSCIADYNIASILAHERMKAQTLGHVAVLKLGRLQFTFGAKPWACIIKNGFMPTAGLKLPQGAKAELRAASQRSQPL